MKSTRLHVYVKLRLHLRSVVAKTHIRTKMDVIALVPWTVIGSDTRTSKSHLRLYSNYLWAMFVKRERGELLRFVYFFGQVARQCCQLAPQVSLPPE
jgi:hypothetical protein